VICLQIAFSKFIQNFAGYDIVALVDMTNMLIWNLAGSVDQNGDKDSALTIRIQSASTGKRNENSQEYVPASLEGSAGNSVWHPTDGVQTFEKMEKILNFSTGGMLSELWAMSSRSQKCLSLYTLTCTHAIEVPNE